MGQEIAELSGVIRVEKGAITLDGVAAAITTTAENDVHFRREVGCTIDMGCCDVHLRRK